MQKDMKNTGFFVIIFTLCLLNYLALGDQWAPGIRLNIPQYPYGFLTASPSGDLLITTINTTTQPREIPALLIKNPTTAQPTVIELCKVGFQSQRGFGGIACDQEGYFYLSGDTGDRATCFVQKYTPSGQVDSRFGVNGTIKPQRRCLGLDVVGKYLLLAVDWGEILIFESPTGIQTGIIKRPSIDYFVRDISIDPTTMNIFGVARGGIVVWHGGSPWEPNKYTFDEWMPAPAAGIVRAGEGISFDPIKRAALITPAPGNTLFEVSGKGSVNQAVISIVASNKHLADSCLSFDGNTLFVTDIISHSIYTMTRVLTNESTTITPTYVMSTTTVKPIPTPLQQTAEKIPRVEWHRSYLQAVEQARRQQRPMIVYFRKNGFPKCIDVENNILLTDEFNRIAQNYVCVFEDVAYNTLTAYRLGVYRVPHIQVQDAQGNIIGRIVFNINRDNLFKIIPAIP